METQNSAWCPKLYQPKIHQDPNTVQPKILYELWKGVAVILVPPLVIIPVCNNKKKKEEKRKKKNYKL